MTEKAPSLGYVDIFQARPKRKGGKADDRTALAARTRTGAGAHHRCEPAALSQPVRLPQPDAAAHEAHRVERDVCDHVGRGFPRAAAVYGAHGLPGAHCTAAGRAFCRRAPAAAVCAVGRFPAACADVVDTVHPRLGDRNADLARPVRSRGAAAARGDGRAYRRAHLLDRHPPHPLADIAAAA